MSNQYRYIYRYIIYLYIDAIKPYMECTQLRQQSGKLLDFVFT